MSERMFNPSDPKYKRVEDLPKKEQANFANVEEGGFVRKEAKEEFDDAKKIVELANEFKRAGITVKDIHWNVKAKIPKEIRAVLNDEEITTTNVLRNRALEECKPTDVLQDRANDIHNEKVSL